MNFVVNYPKTYPDALQITPKEFEKEATMSTGLTHENLFYV